MNGKLILKMIYFKNHLSYIKYPYGDVNYFDISWTNNLFLINSPIYFFVSSPKLLSFKGVSKKVNYYVMFVYEYRTIFIKL